MILKVHTTVTEKDFLYSNMYNILKFVKEKS